jgi:hypothetical protein
MKFGTKSTEPPPPKKKEKERKEEKRKEKIYEAAGKIIGKEERSQ